MSIEIDQALISEFIDGDFGLDIAHENLSYSPSDEAYVELIILQNDRTALTLSHSDETDGVFRAILRYPANTGAIAAKTKAGEITSHFKIGTRLTYNGVSLTITGSQRQPGTQEKGWYKLIINLPYRAILTR